MNLEWMSIDEILSLGESGKIPGLHPAVAEVLRAKGGETAIVEHFETQIEADRDMAMSLVQWLEDEKEIRPIIAVIARDKIEDGEF